jgi:peptidoglycan/LPS O-acetylase OafA/YrhL
MQHRFNVLDSFRGLAAIFVVMFHLHFVGSITELAFFRGSHLFVDFFFVLSGFVLAHRYGFDNQLNIKDFFISRTFRIFPLHVLMLAVFIGFELLKLLAQHYGFGSDYVPFSQKNAANEILPNLLLLQAWLPNVQTMSWNGPAWSISVEYYLYLLFFMALQIKGHYRHAIWPVVAYAAFYLIWIDYKAAREVMSGLSCFFGGATIYLVYRFCRNFQLNSVVFSITEVALLFAIGWMMSVNFGYQGVYASWLFCLVVLVFAFEKGIVSQLFKNTALLKLGQLSYSIYLTHLLMILSLIYGLKIIEKTFDLKLVYAQAGEKYIHLGSTLVNNIAVIAMLVLVITVANFTYQTIEIKGKQLGEKLRKMSW